MDCLNGKHMGSDFVICASPQLLDAEARLEDAYKAARAGANKQRVRTEQIEWIKHYGTDCGLPFRGQPASGLIDRATPCVMEAIEQRIHRLQQDE